MQEELCTLYQQPEAQLGRARCTWPLTCASLPLVVTCFLFHPHSEALFSRYLLAEPHGLLPLLFIQGSPSSRLPWV